MAVGLGYAVWAFLVGGLADAPMAKHLWLIGACFAGALVVSVALLGRGHRNAVRNFERGGPAEFDVVMCLRQLNNGASADRALALSQLDHRLLDDPRVCDALLELADDDRIPEGPSFGKGRSIADLARDRLAELSPNSGAWTAACARKLAVDPTLSEWLPKPNPTAS